MAKLHFSVGENLGKVLLEIAQEHILNGESEKAIETYTKSFFGMDESYILQILKNRCVVKTCEDGVNINLVDDKNVIDENANNIYDWQEILNNKENDLRLMRESYYEIRKQFDRHCGYRPIYDVNITELVERYFGEDLISNIGIHNLAAKLIAGEDFAWSKGSNGSNVWGSLCANVENDDAKNYEYSLYFIVKYVNLIRRMYKDYVKFVNSYEWLWKNGFIDRISFVESNLEDVLRILNEFCNPNKGYYHPMCDEQIATLKDTIIEEILKTSYGKEYLRYGILKKNIMDGYDAGWLSPDGAFYGGLGETSAMIHMNIADEMFNKLFDKKLLIKDKSKESSNEAFNSVFNREDPETYLMHNGWMKIHHDEIYGHFIGSHDDTEYKYCPTKIQVRAICDYVDKFYNKKFYTQPQIVRHTEPITTYKLRQMDDVQLHGVFRL